MRPWVAEVDPPVLEGAAAVTRAMTMTTREMMEKGTTADPYRGIGGRPKKVSDPILPLLVYSLPGENRFNTKFGKLVLANTATPSELKHWLHLFKGYFEDGRGHLCTLSTQYRLDRPVHHGPDHPLL